MPLPPRDALDAADARARAYARPGAPLDAAARADADAAARARAYADRAAARDA